MSTKKKGIVEWFNDSKGYGYIECSTGGLVFVHYTSIIKSGFKSLREGEEVLFIEISSSGQRHATEVEELSK